MQAQSALEAAMDFGGFNLRKYFSLAAEITDEEVRKYFSLESMQRMFPGDDCHDCGGYSLEDCAEAIIEELEELRNLAAAEADAIRAEEHKEACEQLAIDIEHAIRRSISHNERVSVAIDASTLDFADAFTILGSIANDYDTARENDGSEDVWGEFDGDSFRLNVYTA